MAELVSCAHCASMQRALTQIARENRSNERRVNELRQRAEVAETLIANLRVAMLDAGIDRDELTQLLSRRFPSRTT